MSTLISKEEVLNIIKKDFVNIYTGLCDIIQTAPVNDVQIKDDDVFLIGCPKSGTTWLQELIWLVGNDLNYDGAKQFIDERFPLLEAGLYEKYTSQAHEIFNETRDCHMDGFSYINNMKRPRFLKTHLAPEFLPTRLSSEEKKIKIIYISRNVKDVCLSYYYYTKNILKLHNASLDDFCKVFIGFRSTFWQSVLNFWNLRNEKNILFVRYEEMKTNLRKVIQQVASFLEKPLTEAQEEELMKWLDFDKIKTNTAVNHNSLYKNGGFIRSGKVGEHKQEMSPEIISLFDAWIKESLKDSDYVELC